MPRFFIEAPGAGQAVITGADARHIARVLRMREGEAITLCDQQGFDYSGVIAELSENAVSVDITGKFPSKSEPSIHVHLFQAMPKSDKMELIIQKSVELGVCEITPVFTKRCVSRPDAKSMRKKLERYRKISLEAAKQSGRGCVPVIHEALSLDDALAKMSAYTLPLCFYEQAKTPLREVLGSEWNRVSILIGSEGGFEEWEAEQAAEAGCRIASLGPRILRCETAPLAALSAIMFASGNL